MEKSTGEKSQPGKKHPWKKPPLEKSTCEKSHPWKKAPILHEMYDNPQIGQYDIRLNLNLLVRLHYHTG